LPYALDGRASRPPGCSSIRTSSLLPAENRLAPGSSFARPGSAERFAARRADPGAAERGAGGISRGALYGESLGVALAARVVREYAVARAHAPEPRGGLPLDQLRPDRGVRRREHRRELSLQELSQQLEMSVHFSSDRSAEHGLPPHQYVLRRRVERAKELLVDPRCRSPTSRSTAGLPRRAT